MQRRTSSANINLWFDLREARNLDVYEYTFLSVVASRGTMTASVERAAADMKMSRSTFYKVRSRLLARNLIVAIPHTHGTTHYEVNHARVRELIPQRIRPSGGEEQEPGSLAEPSSSLKETFSRPRQERVDALTETALSPLQHPKNTRKNILKTTETREPEKKKDELVSDQKRCTSQSAEPESQPLSRREEVKGLVIKAIMREVIAVDEPDDEGDTPRLYSYGDLHRVEMEVLLTTLEGPGQLEALQLDVAKAW